MNCSQISQGGKKPLDSALVEDLRRHRGRFGQGIDAGYG
jgi:hypothetical protein